MKNNINLFNPFGLLCTCPQGAAISDLTYSDCPEDFGQVQKIIFQRLKKADGSRNSFTIATANPNLLASWTPLLAAADGTKVTVTPYISAPETEPGAKIEFGSGNAVVGGIPVVVGRSATTFEAMFLRQSQSFIKLLKTYECESVGVFLIDEYGRIAGLNDTHTSPTKVYPIPIRSFFVSDKDLGGFEEPDKNMVSWSFLPNWSDQFHIVVPSDFDALNDL